jgi:hypothetical protein
VFDVKRLIGRKFDDKEVQADIKHFPFTVLGRGGKPYIRVQYHGEQKEFVSLLFSCSGLWFDCCFYNSRRKKLAPWFFSK